MSNIGDQAASLRDGAAARQSSIKLNSGRSVCCVAVASGKGGVGKTFLTVNMAVGFAKMNKKVLLVDADLGLANADIILGVSPEYSMQDVIFKGRSFEDVVVETNSGIDLIAASSGSKEMVSMGDARMSMFISELVSFASHYDVLLFDCAAGIDSSVTSFIGATPQSVIVATAQPTSVMDVYALIKIIHRDNLSDNIGLVVNMVDSDEQGKRVAKTLDTVCNRYLSKSMDLLGIIPNSQNAQRAINVRKPFIELYPDDDASCRIRTICKNILQRQSAMGRVETLDAARFANGILKI